MDTFLDTYYHKLTKRIKREQEGLKLKKIENAKLKKNEKIYKNSLWLLARMLASSGLK